MQDGHPYLTEALDEQRARQRRVLRDVPDWVTERIKVGQPGSVPADLTDRALLETLTRADADRRMERIGYLDKFRAHTEAVAYAQWIGSGQSSQDWRFQDVVDDAYAARNAAALGKYPVGADKEDAAITEVTRFVTLLVWADALAGDYTDPRWAATSSG